MDTRFSAAIHTLVLISEADTPMSSEDIAFSVGTNSSYVRKLTVLLKGAGIIESHQGRSGFSLCVKPKELTLMKIYQAIYETDRMKLFDIHQNTSDECIVGRHIKPVLARTFRSIEDETEEKLKNTTLADCIKNLRKEAGLLTFRCRR